MFHSWCTYARSVVFWKSSFLWIDILKRMHTWLGIAHPSTHVMIFLLMALIVIVEKLSYVACRMFDYCDCCPKAIKKVGLHGILKGFDFDCAIF